MRALIETYKKPLLIAVAFVAIIGSIVVLESRKVDTGSSAVSKNQDVAVMDENDRVAAKATQYERAKEISTPDGFINTDGVAIGELVGKKVVLVDFWTYSCINCQRTLPHLNAWYKKYADDGLAIIGVHTPEFEFEQKYDNVARAVEKFGIKYPVVLDNDYSTWRSYKNQYWPRKYLIDIDGFIVYDHIGEGGYEETEEKIVELLNERSEVLGMEEVVMDMSEPESVDDVDFTQVRSPEMYFGHSRLEYLANLPAFSCYDTNCEFNTLPSIDLNTFALDGTWEIKAEEASLKSSPGRITLGFSASKVNLVAGATGVVHAEIYLDGEPVGSRGGADVTESVAVFSSHDLYNLVDLGGEYGEHILEIRFLDPNISVFALTFG